MDPVTHIVSGALGGRALKDQFETRWAYALTITAAWLPDIDNFVGLGPEQYLLHHRGITHSVIGILVQALLLTGVFRLFGRNFSPLKTFATAMAMLTVHLWLDVITTYGTQLLAPFDTTRFQWGSVFIIDPILTLTAFILFIAAIRSKIKGKAIAVSGLLLLFIYPLGNHSVRNSVESALPPILKQQNLEGRPFEVTTDALAPIFWKIIVHDGDKLLVGSTTALPAAQDTIEFETFTAADPALLKRLGDKASFFATWDWFALYPTMRDVPVPQGENATSAVSFMDARFFSNSPLAREYMSERYVPFQITALFDAEGNMTRFLYNHHSATVAYSVTN